VKGFGILTAVVFIVIGVGVGIVTATATPAPAPTSPTGVALSYMSGGVVGARSHLQDLTDGLDSELGAVRVDVVDDHRCGRSS
jgi:hypothetical protein